jgi:hypothetical protein
LGLGGGSGLAVAATTPGKRRAPTPAQQRAAAAKRHALATGNAALLRHSDVRGWSSAPPPKKVPGLTCTGFNPNVTAFAPLASVASPTFNQTSQGPFTAQVVYVFSSDAMAESFWHRVVTPRLLVCVADSLVAGSSSGVTFTVNDKHLEAYPTIGDRSRGYRVIGTATLQLGSDQVYLDELVIGKGNAITALSFTSFFSPVPRSLELRLARTVAGRLPSG